MKEVQDFIRKEASDVEVKSFQTIYKVNSKSTVRYWTYGVFGSFLLLVFLPWTQNIRARGSVTTLRQEQRPQELNSIIGGRIVKWYVKEGDFVKNGDTIAQLAEIKDAYLDPQLLDRTQEQLEAKQASIEFYQNKVAATDAQTAALRSALQLKMQQNENKIRQLQLKILADSMEMIAGRNEFSIAQEQYGRAQVMRDSGLLSLVQLEQRNQSFQNALAKKMSAEIKFTNTKTDMVNAQIELAGAQQEYLEKISKAQSDRATAQSDQAASQAEVAKLSNQFENYKIRSGMYFLIAPQDGQVVQAKKSGINEIVKEGEMLVEIVPLDIQYAVEMFVRPVDLPLLAIGQKVRFMFDGYPAIVFSGWPAASYGTFGGKVVAIESSVSNNGSFRVLVGEDPADRVWPATLKLGTGASGIALLKDVPIWYELWRNINGFPPDYYQPKAAGNEKK